MTTINLRELYPWYTEDTFIEVSDEVAAFLEEDIPVEVEMIFVLVDVYRNKGERNKDGTI